MFLLRDPLQHVGLNHAFEMPEHSEQLRQDHVKHLASLAFPRPLNVGAPVLTHFCPLSKYFVIKGDSTVEEKGFLTKSVCDDHKNFPTHFQHYPKCVVILHLLLT